MNQKKQGEKKFEPHVRRQSATKT